MLQSFALLLRATYRWRWVWSNGEIILRGENWSTGRKTLSSATLSTTNPIRINQALKRSFRGESSATNRTNTMEQSSSWAARRSWVSQETPRTLWHPKVHYRIHKSPPPVTILSPINPVHASCFCFFKVRLHSIFHLRLGFPNTLFLSGFLTKSLFPTCATCPAYLFVLDLVTRLTAHKQAK